MCNLNGGAPCPEGYSCTRGKKGHGICCTGKNRMSPTFSPKKWLIKNKFLACSINQVYVNGECYDKVGIGARCYDPEQCLGGGVCNEDGVCSCRTGYFNEDGHCIKRREEKSRVLGRLHDEYFQNARATRS